MSKTPEINHQEPSNAASTSSCDKRQSSGSDPAPEVEEVLTWPGSCETSSPVDSPTEPTATEIMPSRTNLTGLETPSDSSILDPVFIEKLGEEISFLNQTSTDEITSLAPALNPSSSGACIDNVTISNSAVPPAEISG